ncbi:MAG: response regulator transcription factor [Treponema sp.]|nr:response regulator transcription factor [Treponema sp.]
MSEKINILIVSRQEEEQKRILEALSNEEQFVITDVVKDAIDAMIKSEKYKPDILIIDSQPIELTGPDLIRIFLTRSPSTQIIMLCSKEEEDKVSFAIKAGISGFLFTEEDIDKLALIVKLVFKGGKYISASLILRVFSAVSLLKQFPGQFTEIKNGFFTPAEHSIVRNLARGYSDEEIAKELNFNVGSIRNCLTVIRKKTKLRNRIEIVIFSLIYGLINFDNFSLWDDKRDLIFNGKKPEKPGKKTDGKKSASASV